MLFFWLTSPMEQSLPAQPAELDEALFPRIAAGDREALAELYRQTDSAVYGFILSILKNRHDAEDVLQDTYLQISRSAGSYRPQGKPMAWVLTVARNLARMRLRKEARSVPVEDLESCGRPAAEESTDEDRLMLDSALRLLGEQERQIVLLHAASGLRHREIALLLGIPLSTVLSKYARSLAKLRKYWNGGTER